MTTEQRVAPVELYKPELASFNAGSINFALFHVMPRYKEWMFEWEKQYLGFTEDFTFPNTFKSTRGCCAKFNETGTKPEFGIYDSGRVNNVAFVMQEGCVRKPVYIQFVMGVPDRPHRQRAGHRSSDTRRCQAYPGLERVRKEGF